MNLPILMYHHLLVDDVASPHAISISQLRQQVDLLSRGGFTTISFRQLANFMAEDRKPPRKSIILTFDDGYESFRELAVPVLTARGMTATVFVVAGEIGGDNRWDFDRGYPRRTLMDDAGIREVLAKGMEVGSHGWAHRDLTVCSDAERDEELARSRQELHRRFGVDADAFAYPYGRYSTDQFEHVARAGYRVAVSIFSDEPSVTANPLAMRRIYVHEGDTALRFEWKLTPLYLRYVAWRDSARESSAS